MQAQALEQDASRVALPELSTAESSFILINSTTQSDFASSDTLSIQSGINSQDTQNGSLKGLEEAFQVPQRLQQQTSGLKRKASLKNLSHTPKRQIQQQSPISPFQTLQITKLDIKQHDPPVNHSVTCCSAVKTTMGEALAQSEHLRPETTVGCLAPYHTRYSPCDDSDSDTPGTPIDYMRDRMLAKVEQNAFYLEMVPSDVLNRESVQVSGKDRHLSTNLTESVDDAGSLPDESDEFGFDEILRQDMLRMAAEAHAHIQRDIPPSSAGRWGRYLRSAESHDPKHRHAQKASYPDLVSALDTPIQCDSQTDREDFSDGEVDWDAVRTVTDALSREASLAGLRDTVALDIVPVETPESRGKGVVSQVREDEPIASFIRPPFPAKALEKSPVPGLFPQTVLRMCFRIGHLISQASYNHKHHQDAVFELYARVIYSSREILARKQHFQFVDLFKDQQPYLSGILNGWRVGSLPDRQSQIFSNTSTPKLCWCMCRPMKDQKVLTGWVLEIMRIRETTWAQIRNARMICGAGA